MCTLVPLIHPSRILKFSSHSYEPVRPLPSARSTVYAVRAPLFRRKHAAVLTTICRRLLHLNLRPRRVWWDAAVSQYFTMLLFLLSHSSLSCLVYQARGRLLLFEVDYAFLAKEDGEHEHAVKLRQVFAKEQLGPVSEEVRCTTKDACEI